MFIHHSVEGKQLNNKFEVSKIYMTACMCIYKFCQTKEYLFMIFFCFIQNLECFIIFILIKIHVLLHSKKYNQDFSCLFKILNDIHVLSLIFMKYSRFFKIIYVLLKILSYLCILFIKNSCFINDFDDFFKIFQDFSRFFMFYSRS